jgi:hypothetical protein
MIRRYDAAIRGVFRDFVFTAAPLIAVARWGLLLLYALTAFQGVRRKGREGWYASAIMLVLAAGLYGGELHYFGTPGIWLPFGIGLSLSECAYAAFAPLMAALLLKRLWAYAHLLEGPTGPYPSWEGRSSAVRNHDIRLSAKMCILGGKASGSSKDAVLTLTSAGHSRVRNTM